MPSPFPGMDPYLEHPALFSGLHNRLITRMSEVLQAALPAPYYAEIAERTWVEVSSRDIEPDVIVLRGDGPSRPSSEVATVASRPGPLVVNVPVVDPREIWVEIRAGVDGREQLVASIEVLSLTNKTTGRRGRDLYLQKQREILDSPTHLIEIDLLRAGRHTVAVPRERITALAGPFDYVISVHRFDRLEDFEVYPIRLEDRLPEVAFPLLPGDPDVAVDLQAVFDHCYDVGPYRRRVRYQEDAVVPPLSEERSAWASHLISTREGKPSP